MTTEAQIALLHHTLGVRPDRREPYRNYFLAGTGHHDMPDLEALEAAGFMARRGAPAFCEPGDIVFHVTDAGREFALDNLPQPPKRSRYDDYYHSESTLTFAEWLGIEVPKRETNYWASYGSPQRNCVRLKSSKATGDWCKTLKEAKASYKAKLAERRATIKNWSKA